MNRSGNASGLRRSAVDWYANTLAAVVLLGAATFPLIALEVGPVGLLLTFSLSLAIIFTVLFLSLATGSDFVYELLGSL